MPQTKLRESAQKLVFESRTTDDDKLAIRHHELSFSPIMLLFRQTQKFEHYLCLFLSDSQDSLFYIGCKLPRNYGVCLSSLTELVIQKRHQSFPSWVIIFPSHLCIHQVKYMSPSVTCQQEWLITETYSAILLQVISQFYCRPCRTNKVWSTMPCLQMASNEIFNDRLYWTHVCNLRVYKRNFPTSWNYWIIFKNIYLI